MSAGTQLQILLTFDRWAEDETPPQALLEASLPSLQDTLEPGQAVSILRLYRLQGGTLVLGAATDDSHQDALALKDHPTLAEAMDLGQPLYDSSRAAWVVPLGHELSEFRLLEIATEGTQADTDALLLLAGYLSLALDKRALRRIQRPGTTPRRPANFPTRSDDISERQKLAFNELVAGQSLADMAAIIARHMLPEPQRTLTLLHIEDDGRGTTTWTPEPVNGQAADFDLSWDSLGDAFGDALLNGESIDLTRDEAEESAGPIAAWMSANALTALLLLPISVQNRLAAVLLIRDSQGRFGREEINAFSNLCDQMGALMQVRQLVQQARRMNDIIDSLTLANRLIASATDYAYIAQGITYTLARGLLAVAITLFDRPLGAGQHPRSRTLVGWSTPDGLLPLDETTPREDVPGDEALSRLRESLPVIVADFDRDGDYLSPATRDQYRDIGGRWMASFGLRSGDELLGTLDLIHDAPYTLSSEEIDGYSTLADQVGTRVRSRQLLEESRAAQETAAQLVQTNRAIAAAENYGAIVEAVFATLPDSIPLTGILLFDQPVSYRDTPKSARLEVIATRAGVDYPNLTDAIDPETPGLREMLRTLLDGEMQFLSDDSSRNPLLASSLGAMKQRGLYAFSGVGLRSGARLLGVIIFAAADAAALTGIHADNLRAIGGQVAIAIENRILLDQTAEALSFVAAQYEMSRALYRAKSPEEMLYALQRFTEGVYPRAYFGLIDEATQQIRVIADVDAVTDTVEAVPLDSELRRHALPEELNESDTHTIKGQDRRTLSLPLFDSQQQMLGVVVMLNEDGSEMPFNRQRALRSLADQMAITLENRSLLQRTNTALKETRLLYRVNQALLEAQDALEVLQIIRDTVVGQANSVALSRIEYDISERQVQTYVLECFITPQAAQYASVDLLATSDPAQLAQLKSEWDRLASEPRFIERIDANTVLNPTVGYLSGQGVEPHSTVTIPIYDDETLAQQITLVFTSPQQFDESTRRFYGILRDQLSIILQNQRLLRDMSTSAARLGNQIRVLQSLNQLAVGMTALQDEKTLLDEAAQSLVTALRVDHVGITTLSADGRSAIVISEYPVMGMVGLEIDATNPLQEQIRRQREPIIIRNVDTETGLSDENRLILIENGIKAMAFLPLVDTQDNYLGAIGLDVYREGFVFTDEVIEVSRTIAAQVTIGMQNIRQVKNTQKQALQLQKLADFSQIVQSQLEITAIVQAVAERAHQIIALDYLSVLMNDHDSSALRLVVRTEYGQIFSGRRDVSVPLEGTTAGRGWKERDFLYFRELSQEQNLRYTFVDGAGSVLVAPIFARGVALGIIEIASSASSAYAETDQIIFRQLVTQVGIAIENAQAYAQTRRLAEAKAQVNEISARMQQQTDLNNILDVTMRELGKALNARRGRIRLLRPDALAGGPLPGDSSIEPREGPTKPTANGSNGRNHPKNGME